MPIKFLYVRQIFDSMGVPTVEVDMVTDLGLFRVGVPNTDVRKKERRGNVEAHQLRDGVPDEYHGMGVTMAVKNINIIISPELIKMNLEVTMQKEIDQFMCAMDGTENKSRLGSNAIMAVSMVVAKAGAAKKGLPLYRYISRPGVISLVMPVPHFVILNGGILATNDLPMQEYSIMPTAATSFSEAMRVGTEIYTYVKNIIRNKYGVTATYPRDNGGFSVPLGGHRDALLFLTDAINECGYFGKVDIALNAAAGDMNKDRAYDFDFKNPDLNPQDYLSADKLVEIYLDNMKEFPVVSIEDPFDSDDWAAWTIFTPRTTNQILANELTQTNVKKIIACIDRKACTSVAIRLSQSATLTAIIEAFRVISSSGMGACVVDRWGDTDDLFLADLVVGLSAGQVKCGGLSRSERVGKYNQILRIEEEVGAMAKYAGKNFRVLFVNNKC